MRLCMFGIDGTLTDTVKVDKECFVRSLAEACGFFEIETDWSHYEHATDGSIFREIHEVRTGRPPSIAEVSRSRQHYVALLARAASESAFAPIQGAPQVLAGLAASAEHQVSLATGGWRDPARLKMASAGMCFDDYPAATADDAIDRESIMKLSLHRATERNGGRFIGTAYIGDGVWDARACRALRIPFVGIGSGAHAAQLTREGAIHVFPDFSNYDLFLESINTIPPPA